jgi:hypothetical protein
VEGAFVSRAEPRGKESFTYAYVKMIRRQRGERVAMPLFAGAKSGSEVPTCSFLGSAFFGTA